MIELTWNPREHFIEFQLVAYQHGIPLEDWTSHEGEMSRETRRGCRILRQLHEEELASLNGAVVQVPHETVATLSPGDLRSLGLPDPSPWTLRLEGIGLVSDPDFMIRWQLLWKDQRPVMGMTRLGSVAEAGRQRYVLLDPMYSLLKLCEQISSSDLTNEDRLLIWGRIRSILPGDSFVEGVLREIEVVVAGGFSLDPFLNQEGTLDVAPIPASIRRPGSGSGEGPTFELGPAYEGRDLLPPADVEDFQYRFRKRSKVQRTVPLRSGTFVVMPIAVQRALQAVRDVQRSGDPRLLRQLVSNPVAYLREACPELDEEEIETIFVEPPGYGDRVREIGAWDPPVLPFLGKEPQTWVPGDVVGLKVGSEYFLLSVEDLPSLEDSIDTAITKGIPSIVHKGQSIPATESSLEAVRTLRELLGKPVQPPPPPPPQSSAPESTVLIIADNFEEGLYTKDLSRRPPLAASLEGLRSTLLEHQRDGVDWLRHHWESGSPGALLADDMGLGKTLQALVFMSLVRKALVERFGEDLKRPMLVVAPTGLLKNWEDEAQIHLEAGVLGPPFLAYGSNLKRLVPPGHASGKETSLRAGIATLDVDELARQVWVLATYEAVRDYQFSFGKVQWSVIVFDETQKIKNPKALMTHAAKALQADFELAMTGTPVENRLADLWCIVDTCQPGRLKTLAEFVSQYETGDEDQLRRLNETLRKGNGQPSILLRRLKEEQLTGLPDKSLEIRRRTMGSFQADRYMEVVNSARGTAATGRKVLEAIQRIRAVSLFAGDDPLNASDDELLEGSARIAEMVSVLDTVAEKGEKALVFLESRALQPTLASFIQRRYGLTNAPLIINGAINGAERKRRVNIFQKRKGFDVMLLSPQAGGVGLTLTAANHVVHLSRWWNPAVERQATDRVYRIGQRRPVTVYLPLAIHPAFDDASFDVRLHELLTKKVDLFNKLMLPPVMTNEDITNLLNRVTEPGEIPSGGAVALLGGGVAPPESR